VDYSNAMLERARERVRREGWKNVELVWADAAGIELEEKVDAALCTLAIGVIPDYRRALERMVALVKPGGRLALGDAKRSSLWYGRPLIGWRISWGSGRLTWCLGGRGRRWK